jgi:lysophospholipase
MVRAAEALDLPRPWYLLAHSMGGAIGLRAVMDGLPVEGCAFSAPMWGILLPQPLRPVAYTISMCATQLGCGNAIAPSTRAESYLLTEPFENNKLTRDREMYDYMRSHVELEPRLGLGGPSLRWLYQALTEGNQLARRPSPAMPCLTWLGSDEQIVDPARIQTRMANWPCGKLEVVEDGRHEMLMEDRALRRSIVDRTLDFFEHSDANTPCRAKEA